MCHGQVTWFGFHFIIVARILKSHFLFQDSYGMDDHGDHFNIHFNHVEKPWHIWCSHGQHHLLSEGFLNGDQPTR